jgi:hypothetical protein
VLRVELRRKHFSTSALQSKLQLFAFQPPETGSLTRGSRSSKAGLLRLNSHPNTYQKTSEMGLLASNLRRRKTSGQAIFGSILKAAAPDEGIHKQGIDHASTVSCSQFHRIATRESSNSWLEQNGKGNRDPCRSLFLTAFTASTACTCLRSSSRSRCISWRREHQNILSHSLKNGCLDNTSPPIT